MFIHNFLLREGVVTEMSLLRKPRHKVSQKAKGIVVLATITALVFGGVALTSQSASAHTGDLNATAVCNTTTGEFDVTYKLTTSKTGLDGSTKWRIGNTAFESTPTSNAGMDRGPVASTGSQTVTLGTISVPGTSKKAPWAYAFTVWTDNFKKGSDGGDINLAGNCEKTLQADASASVSTTPPTCDTAGTLVLGNITNATWGEVTYSGAGNLHYSVPANAVDGSKFPASAGVSSDGKTQTFSGELGAATLDCPVTPVASSTDETCDAIGTLTLGSGHYTWQLTIDKDVPELGIAADVPFTVPSGTWLATFSALGNDPSGPHYYGTVVAQATADPGHSVGDSQSKWTFTFTKQDCRTIVTPVKPAITEVETCDTYGSVTPVETEGVKYVVEFDKMTGEYSVTATPKNKEFWFKGEQSVVFTGNVGAYVACPGVVTPVTPKADDKCEVSNDKYKLPPGSEGISYAFDSKKGVVATLTSDKFIFDETLPAGYVLSEDGLSATYAYSNFKWTDEDCGTLAHTGINSDEMKGILLLSGGSLLVGGLAVAYTAYSRRKARMVA